MTIEELRILISAKIDGLKAGLSAAKSELSSFRNSSTNTTNTISNGMSQIGQAAEKSASTAANAIHSAETLSAASAANMSANIASTAVNSVSAAGNVQNGIKSTVQSTMSAMQAGAQTAAEINAEAVQRIEAGIQRAQSFSSAYSPLGANAKEDISAAEAALERMRAELGSVQESSAEAGRSAQLAAGTAINAIQRAQIQLGILQNSAKTTHLGGILKSTDDAVQNAIEASQDKINSSDDEIAVGAQETAQKVAMAAQEAGQTVQHSASAAGNSLSRIPAMLDRMIIRMFLFHTIIAGIRSFNSFLGSALMTNSAFSNSLAQVRSNLIVAFMPIYSAILPALTSLMRWLAMATQYIAIFISALFGKTYSASVGAAKNLEASRGAMEKLGSASSGAGGKVKKAADDTKKAANEIKESLAGFDEINKLSQDKQEGIGAAAVPSVGGGGGGASLPSDIWPVIDTSPTQAAIEKITAAAKKFKDIMSVLGPIILGVLGFLAGFKILLAITNAFNGTTNSITLFGTMAAHPILTVIALVAAAVTTVVLLYNTNRTFHDFVNKALSWLSGNGVSIIVAVTGALMTVMGAMMLANSAGIELAGTQTLLNAVMAANPIGIVIVAIAGLVAALVLLYQKWESFRNFVKETWGVLKTIGKGITDVITAPFTKAIPSIDLCKGKISSATKQSINDFEYMNKNVSEKLMVMKATGEKVTNESAKAIEKSFSNMTQKIDAGFEQHKKTDISQLQDLMNKRGVMTSAEYADAVAKVTKKYSDEEKATNDANSRIQTIMENASKQHRTLTQSEYDEIAKIQDTMQSQGIKALSKNQQEQRVIFENLKNQHGNISAQEAAEVVRNSVKQRDAVISDANKTYDQTVKEIIHQRDDLGSISSDEAAKMIQKAKEQRDGTIQAAETQHNKIVDEARKQAGEHADCVDWGSGQIKSKWRMMQDSINQTMNGLGKDIRNKWEEIREYVPRKVQELKDDVIEKWREMRNGIRSWWNSMWDFNIPHIDMPHFSIRGSFSLDPPSIPRIGVNWYARGGVFNHPTTIGVGEAGAEAVVPLENTPFVQKIASAVGDAVLKSMQKLQRNQSSSDGYTGGDVVLKVGETELGRVSAKAINSASRQAGKPLLIV